MFGGDLVSNTQKLGRALETFDGYTVLTREIGKFTPAQKAAIENFQKSNDLIGYQNYPLEILQGKVGGSAAAVEEAGTGWGALNVELKSLADNVGGLLLPEVKDLTQQMTILLRTINDNFNAIRNLYIAVEYLHRALVGIASLGLSEVFRWLFRGGGNTPETAVPAGGFPHAAGGSWMVPAAYGYEGYQMGGGHTASAGEIITVTPANSSPGQSVHIENLYIGGSAANMSRGDLTEMMSEALRRAVGARQ